MAGDKPWPQVPIGNKDHTQAFVVIIGAGISGLCTAIDLITKNKCKNFIILEKSGGLGGTWRDNKYPGCCCDVWSHLYSYSFEQNPDWTREYPGQEEILEYLVGVAQKYELYRYVRFNTAVESAVWDDAAKKWKTKVQVQGNKDAEFCPSYTITSDFLVSAVGQLNVPQMPSIPGLDEFKGKLMHSARWDWSYDLQGKAVAIIGNGATAAQIIPEIAPVVGSLTVYQRTPNWIVPRGDMPIPAWKRSLYRWVPYVRQRKRADFMDFREWTYGFVQGGSTATSAMFRDMSDQLMKTQLPNREDLWKKLRPEYDIGCKRIIISDDYFPVFNRDNVRLETRHIDRITEDGIVAGGEEQKYDLIICATGFKTVEFMYPIDVRGTGGRAIGDIWKEGGEALYGVTVESLPNFGMLYGPNTNLGHNSIILMIEAQSRYINALIAKVLEARLSGGQLVIQPNHQRMVEYNNKLQEELANTSFADPRCGSWYKRKDNGKITQNWSSTVIHYQTILSKVDWSDYDVSGTGAEKLKADGAVTKLGRVVEESLISYKAMGLTLASLAAVGTAFAFRGMRLR
ncbi:uncharacterized protein PV09_06242 [Verruconis gallopava]|uniref:FAD/NAD(P)-binding domain-containing protein n=1 Tax=Verruconis gallopava TaxID=253628 RepID=A0A0D1XJF2_9PEZI|nr:uncharacterized protein PV09_06242 [Verruconis gallopava]KIW02426.1 hypothetical protein PV09_06242 [Verruconis gallopava]